MLATIENNAVRPENEIDPWPEAVTSDVIDDAITDLMKHVMLNEDDAIKAVLWLTHSMVFDWWDKSPRLMITAPMKACGKSTLLGVLEDMSDRKIEAGSCTPAAYVALASRQNQVFFIDEADLMFCGRGANDMTKVLNNGFERGKPYRKMRLVGGDYEPEAFPVYSATAIAGIGLETKMLDSTVSRCLIIRMKKASKHLLPDKYRRKKHQEKFMNHGRKIKRWIHDNKSNIESIEVNLGNLHDERVEDLFEPLMAIAQVHSDSLALRLRRIAGQSDESANDDDVGIALIRDAYEVYFRDQNSLPIEWHKNVCAKGISVEALRLKVMELHAFDSGGDNLWENFHPERVGISRQIQTKEVGKILKDYGITKKSIRAGSQSIKAIPWDSIKQAFFQWVHDDDSCGRVVDVVELREVSND